MVSAMWHLRTREPWTVAMRAPDVHQTINNYMLTVDQVLSDLFSLSHYLGYKPMVLFATLTGLDMTKYNNYPEDLVLPEQKILDKAINAINRNLIIMHKSMGVYPPIIASAVHMRCRGKTRFAKSKLADGCHPTIDLCKIWARRLHYNSQLNLGRFDSHTLTNQMYA